MAKGPVWDFTPQGDKRGYENNPNWVHKDAATPTHFPCGYWHHNEITGRSLSEPILFGVGSNAFGQLAHDYPKYLLNFVPFAIEDVKVISLNYYNMLVVKNDGTLWGMGNNDLAQLGAGHFLTVPALTRIGPDSDWVDVAAGSFFTLAIKSDGTLWGAGANYNGQLGLGPTAPTVVEAFTQIGTDTDWQSVYAGQGSEISGAVKTNGTLWVAGENYYGQLGLGDIVERDVFTQTIITNCKAVSFGYSSTIALCTDGTMYGTGENSYGELGLGNNNEYHTFTQIPGVWREVALVDTFTAALDVNWQLYTTGKNTYGQLGLGDNINRNTFTLASGATWAGVAVTADTTYVISQDLHVWATGYQEAWAESTEVLIEVFTEEISKIIISTYTVVLQANLGAYYAAGENNVNLPIGAISLAEFTVLDPAIDWIAVDAGSYQSLALKADGTLYGTGSYSGLGLGVSTNVTEWTVLFGGQKVKCITAGRGTGFVIREDGTLWGTGANNYGQICQGNTVAQPNWVQIGTDNDWAWVDTGSSAFHVWAQKTNGDLYAWGRNHGGQLGRGTNTPYETSMQKVNFGSVKHFAVGEDHTLVIAADGRLFTCGANYHGALGLGHTNSTTPLTQVGADTDWLKVYGGEYYSYALKTNGKGYSSGDNYNGQLGLGDQTKRLVFTEIPGHDDWIGFGCGCSGSHVLGITSDKSLWTVGRNDYYQLGRGSTNPRELTFAKVMYDSIHDFPVNWTTKVACGILHSIALQELRTTNFTVENDPRWAMNVFPVGQKVVGSGGYWPKT